MYSSEPGAPTASPLSVPSFRRMKSQAQRIVCLTAYDASFASAMDAAGIDLVLVGDSLGMVVQGHASTLPVTVDQMVYHSAAVARGLRRAVLMADLPYQSYATPQRALDSAARLQAEGQAAIIKLEGAGHVLDSIEFLTARDIPVCAHLGLTPQSVLKLGGYRVQGRDAEAAQRLREDARRVAEAGAELLVLECVPAGLAAEITRDIAIPTIGIGAGPDCDGQVLVMHDLLGVTPGRRPRFVKDFLAGAGTVEAAFLAYAEAVRSGSFPAPEHCFQ
ncbi:3-methyl-2-oxobutanoate hydroxymethyltransferase [uncultured Aquimonas sp.]|uniref:3-methyl-2-oxobutanoate hydroxymethyltransferase n=1 Tax=uncultured Aquimonas sp. TaxID=385483 RepID=UPI00086D9045|nr:3-methyl-2-oxobutanoate hydroxymethyltransferase [uncultured Aquimonas sp.]ODU41213.1 MAG: 3-methyl-2-oxobutanoate hydroxymethyltransferase [Xanthomonadaceae bacterium SCN 69-123]